MHRIAVAVFLTLGASSVCAQTKVVVPLPRTSEEIAYIRATCQRAVEAIERVPSRPAPPGSLTEVRFCGRAKEAETLARAIRRMRSALDTTLLGVYWDRAAVIDDRNLFEAAVDIASDSRASTPARVYALLAIVRKTNAHPYLQYSHVVGGWSEEAGLRSVGGGCATQRVSLSHPDLDVGTPLPDSWQQTAIELRERLVANASEPLDVRTAAYCISTWRRPR
jgi:hypothetical protein